MVPPGTAYRGRLAPSPTGLLHLGHARTFWIAWRRARAQNGRLILRIEDLDSARCRPEYVAAIREDLHWLGLDWDEGPWQARGSFRTCSPAMSQGGAGWSPGCGEQAVPATGPLEVGPAGPYAQSERGGFYAEAFRRLQAAGRVYPCTCSRRDIAQALSAPHESSPIQARARQTQEADQGACLDSAAPGARVPSRMLPPGADEEPVYPGTCRPLPADSAPQPNPVPNPAAAMPARPACWRFRVQDGEVTRFTDLAAGAQSYVAGQDFGDFVVWRNDGVAAYQLACVVDDHLMGITEVVRGEDLLVSTARQILLYRALGWTPPAFFHCPLVTGPDGQRLAKRHDALSLRQLRAQGIDPRTILAGWEAAEFQTRPPERGDAADYFAP